MPCRWPRFSFRGPVRLPGGAGPRRWPPRRATRCGGAAALALALALGFALAGCGATGPVVAWRDDMARYFGDTLLQPSEPPRHLWTPVDEELLLKRLGFADCAAVGTTKVVNVYSAISSAQQIAVSFRPQQIVHGSLAGHLDSEGELTLQLTPSADDFRLALRQQQQLAGTRYLVFLKRQPLGDQRFVWRWALYRDDPRLLTEVRAAYVWLKAQRERERGKR